MINNDFRHKPPEERRNILGWVSIALAITLNIVGIAYLSGQTINRLQEIERRLTRIEATMINLY